MPDGSTKDSCRTYDEITIPASATSPPEHLNVLIDIKKLDKFGQLAFGGIKRLNRIQSIVFDAAYNTNENLLISAPTGKVFSSSSEIACRVGGKLHLVNFHPFSCQDWLMICLFVKGNTCETYFEPVAFMKVPLAPS